MTEDVPKPPDFPKLPEVSRKTLEYTFLLIVVMLHVLEGKTNQKGIANALFVALQSSDPGSQRLIFPQANSAELRTMALYLQKAYDHPETNFFIDPKQEFPK